MGKEVAAHLKVQKIR